MKARNRNIGKPGVVLWKGLHLILLCCVLSQFVYGQDAIQFSQYFSNQLIINPAYAGADDALSLTMVHRNQWTGVKGAPRTTTLTGHTLFKNENTGICEPTLKD